MADFEAAGARVYGLSKDSLKSHHAFMAKHGLSVPLLSDTSCTILRSLGGWGMKKVYGKESEGVIRSTLLIDPSGNVAARWPKAASKGHAQEVLESLRVLAAR